MLVFNGRDLIFFRAANMELCFVFVLETVVIIQEYFSYFWAEQKVFSASRPAPPVSRMGGWE